jgi:hypothetical protein
MSSTLKNRNHLIWIIVVILAIIGIAAAVRRTLIVENVIDAFSPPEYPGFDAGFSKHKVLTLVHIIPGTFFMISGPLLFIKKLRLRHFNVYKRIRILFFISAYVTGITALGISYTVSIGGANETAAATLFAIFFIYSLTKALMNISKGRFELYREWVLRAFAIGLAIATVRPIVGLFFALSSLSPHEFFGIAFWIGFTIHLIIAEAWIRHTRPGHLHKTELLQANESIK